MRAGRIWNFTLISGGASGEENGRPPLANSARTPPPPVCGDSTGKNETLSQAGSAGPISCRIQGKGEMTEKTKEEETREMGTGRYPFHPLVASRGPACRLPIAPVACNSLPTFPSATDPARTNPRCPAGYTWMKLEDAGARRDDSSPLTPYFPPEKTNSASKNKRRFSLWQYELVSKFSAISALSTTRSGRVGNAQKSADKSRKSEFELRKGGKPPEIRKTLCAASIKRRRVALLLSIAKLTSSGKMRVWRRSVRDGISAEFFIAPGGGIYRPTLSPYLHIFAVPFQPSARNIIASWLYHSIPTQCCHRRRHRTRRFNFHSDRTRKILSWNVKK